MHLWFQADGDTPSPPTNWCCFVGKEDMQHARSSTFATILWEGPKAEPTHSEWNSFASYCLFNSLCVQWGRMDSSSSSTCLPFYQLMGHVTMASRILAVWSRWICLQGQKRPACLRLPLWSDEEKWIYVCDSNKQSRNNIQVDKTWAVSPLGQDKSSKNGVPTTLVHPSDITSLNVLFFFFRLFKILRSL